MRALSPHRCRFARSAHLSRSGRATFLLVCLLLGQCQLAGAVDLNSDRHASVGATSRIEDLILPGTELEAKPIADRKQPLVVRVANASPHGTAFRYTLVYYGLEPGDYDLRDELRRKDGTATDDLPSIPVTITSVLPSGQVEPHPVAPRSTADFGGYRTLIVVLGFLWGLGLGVLLFVKRGKKTTAQTEEVSAIPLADRLRPMIDDAIAGRLDTPRQAELERMLLAWWRQRLDLEGLSAAEAIARLRQHEEAGVLLRQLEAWLHAPPRSSHVDVAALLAPYASNPDPTGLVPVVK